MKNVDRTEALLSKISLFVGERGALGEKVLKERKDPFSVLVSVLLSARTRDETTEKVVNTLFSRASSPEQMLALTQAELESLLHPLGFYRQKAKHLLELSRLLEERFSGRVPDTREELVSLPGVGRKTANLVLNLSFEKEAICVDTHVHRISNRLGLVKTRTPGETEEALMGVLPRNWWIPINRLLVVFGKEVCLPRYPKCPLCPVRDLCPLGQGEKR